MIGKFIFEWRRARNLDTSQVAQIIREAGMPCAGSRIRMMEKRWDHVTAHRYSTDQLKAFARAFDTSYEHISFLFGFFPEDFYISISPSREQVEVGMALFAAAIGQLVYGPPLTYDAGVAAGLLQTSDDPARRWAAEIELAKRGARPMNAKHERVLGETLKTVRERVVVTL